MVEVAEFEFDYELPIVCTAIHNGNYVSPEIERNLGISFSERLREEDAYTEFFTETCGNRIIGKLSRFEVDLNRDRDNAVYKKPEDAWGLNVRSADLCSRTLDRCLEKYDLFYRETSLHLEKLIERHGRIFVFDIHSYNHRRKGPVATPDDPRKNPEIILGTGSMPAEGEEIVEKIRRKILECSFFGRKIDVRCNIKFSGGHFSRWLHETFPGQVFSLSIEFKKIFMDEWTGMLYAEKINCLRSVLNETFPVVLDKIRES